MKCLEIYQDNIHISKNFNNIITALSQIQDLKYLDINMARRLIRLKYIDNDLNESKIRCLIKLAAALDEI